MSGQAEGLNDIASELSTFLQWLGASTNVIDEAA